VHIKTTPSSSYPAARTVLLAGFVAGTCDIICACTLYSAILKRGSPSRLLQAIASALMGKSAFEGGAWTALAGLLIHYCIAFSFATLFVIVYPYLPVLRRHKVVSGLLYGLFAFILMNAVVLPVIGYAPFKFVLIPSLRQAVILMLAIGLPISLITNKYYRPVIRT
jgi:hypothetical protein